MRLISKLLIFIILGTLLVGFTSADFEIGNLSYSIDTQYGASDNIKGWINISLAGEPTNSLFEDSKGDSITLIELLDKTNDISYSCNTKDCSPDYSVSNGGTAKNFDLEAMNPFLIGFKFSENIDSIDSIDFTIDSDAVSSCSNQLKIDILNDGEIDTGNYKSSGESCVKSYGCFDDSKQTVEGVIGVTPPYCQRINLLESPGFKIGAWVKETGNGSEILTMTLYDLYDADLGSCELPKATSSGGEISCNINYLVKEQKNYYVCINSDGGGGENKIKGYETSNSSEACGFNGNPSYDKKTTAAYQIFAEGKSFGGVGTLLINNSLDYGETISNKMKDYIIEKYGNSDCSLNDCIVPVKIIPREDQSITIKDLSIKYSTPSFSGIIEDEIYDISEIPATITMDFNKISLNKGNFSVLSNLGNYTFRLELNDKEIFSKKVFVESVPVIKSLTPTKTASAYPTEFEVQVSASGNISKYEWDFGDNQTGTSSTNKIIHTYDSTGQYKMKITITDSSQRTSYMTFDITIETPEKVINTSLEEMQGDLAKVKEQIESLDEFEQKGLNSRLDIDSLDSEITALQKDFKKADSEEDYNLIMPRLLALKIPESISESGNTASLLFYPDEKNINLDVLKEIGGGSYESDKRESYINAILFWNMENMETRVKFKEFSVQYGGSGKPLLRIFELKTSEKEGVGYDSYLIIRKLENLDFDANYLESEKSGYEYIRLKKEAYTITFSTTEDIDFASLPAFISPSLDRLDITGYKDPGEFVPSKKKWYIFGLIMIFLFILAFIMYVILQRWYKIKYENYLFKNRNNIYNLITYINNAKKKGLGDDALKSSLRKSGWNSEQVTYIMKKYAGKRTGMFEISPGKIFGMLRRKKQIPQPTGRIPPAPNQRFRPRGPLGMPR
ncbi:MAG TPA: PKD domain-containing protein [Candidatus Pacearchaeota archaeon]|nr:PKD domain protein [archaeon BMS3Abin17]HDK41750.1 PKD domain-containing protein [Candidatus Pacearchaeota archaeon]HDZ61390.1 PKD domain-containing protein [Candidatus Pacearchaeota archaeon]